EQLAFHADERHSIANADASRFVARDPRVVLEHLLQIARARAVTSPDVDEDLRERRVFRLFALAVGVARALARFARRLAAARVDRFTLFVARDEDRFVVVLLFRRLPRRERRVRNAAARWPARVALVASARGTRVASRGRCDARLRRTTALV